jgi:hypothetical protein
MLRMSPAPTPAPEGVLGDVLERSFLHWASSIFPGAQFQDGRVSANIDFTTPPTSSFYWRGKLASRDWVAVNLPSVDRLAELVPGLRDLLLDARYKSELYKESVFESVRASHHPTKPSRTRAMFLLDADQDPDGYAGAMQLARYALYEVTPLSGSLHRAALAPLNCNGELHADVEAHARSYWNHEPPGGLTTEVLFEGRCMMRFLRWGPDAPWAASPPTTP